MTTHHAWFSMQVANRHGSAVYHQLGGSPVNVTRTSPEREGRGPFPHDEKYVGQVLADDPTFPARATTRVHGITP